MERYELKRRGDILNIIEAQHVEGGIPEKHKAEAVVIRDRKVRATQADWNKFREELSGQVQELEGLRLSGVQVVSVEVTEEDGTSLKGPTNSTKTKKSPINTRILELKKEIAKSHDQEGQALINYIPKPAQQHEMKGAVVHFKASEEFTTMFNRMEAQSSDEETIIDVDAVVVDDDSDIG